MLYCSLFKKKNLAFIFTIFCHDQRESDKIFFWYVCITAIWIVVLPSAIAQRKKVSWKPWSEGWLWRWHRGSLWRSVKDSTWRFLCWPSVCKILKKWSKLDNAEFLGISFDVKITKHWKEQRVKNNSWLLLGMSEHLLMD